MQFKLALQTNAAAHRGASWLGPPLPQYLAGMSYGGLHIGKADLRLTPDEAALASSALEHTATFALAVAVDSAFEKIIPDRFNSSDPAIVVAARIARIIRNAFSHDPFFPTWVCTNPNHLGQFAIPDVISLDTSVMNGKEVDWRHYGGPLALLRFVRHCQGLLAGQSCDG